MKTLIVIPSDTKRGSRRDASKRERPTMDYDALLESMRSLPGDEADILDYGSVERTSDLVVNAVRKFAGKNAALALMAFLRRADYDVLFTNAENIALPLALLLKTVSRRPRHVTIGHRLSAKKKQIFYRRLEVHRQMDVIFLYSSLQRDVAKSQLHIPAEKLRLINFHADHRFFRPLENVRMHEDQVCSAGLEWRDYPTLIDAVEPMTDLQVRLAAASPWSKGANETAERTLPAHIDARSYDYRSLRQLYAESSIVVVPLYENDFQAGITTILEAMSMGKAIVATRTSGQTDVLTQGATALYVPPGNVRALRSAIVQLLVDSQLRARLGAQARRWVEQHATLDKWVENVAAALRGLPSESVAREAMPAPAHEDHVFSMSTAAYAQDLAGLNVSERVVSMSRGASG